MHTIRCTSARDRVLMRQFDFPTEDTLSTKREQLARLSLLLKVVTIEEINSNPVIITTEDRTMCVKIKSRIIAVGDSFIHLENGISIPICRIHAIDFNNESPFMAKSA